ncbi:MAG: CopG family transcriptional regulator [archaeon]|nr:CopG family transcriptional regulator [archaeon]
MHNKKENVIAVRLDDNLKKRLAEYTAENNISTSKLTRQAITRYIEIYDNNDNRNIERIIWGKNEFAKSLEFLNDAQIEELAEVSFQNGRKTQDFIFKDRKEMIKVPIKTYMSAFFTAIGNEGQNWFENIQYSWQKRSKLVVAGTHKNGMNFSKYVKCAVEKHLAVYNFIITKEILQDNKMILHCEPKNPKLKKN